MMNRTIASAILLLLVSRSAAQVVLPLQNNWQIPDNSWIKITPGTYTVNDQEADGVIQIVNKHNIILDGDSVTVHGSGFAGYLISILHSDSVTIRNFRFVDSLFYAVCARGSQHITISNCTFSGNKRDSIGFIDVWTDVDQALGGGVLLDSCTSSAVMGNVMKQSNDGVAMYHCDSITVGNNDLSWNTSYGIRMYWTDDCRIEWNNCSHTNRLTDQSDCGAILLIVSNGNRVEHNDLTYSGDGVFLGQYNHHAIPNNNTFEYNDGSYSPHNAFEATFASGNVFKHNIANHSDYGFWLGYSFNTVVDSNQILNNQTAGIAVDRGYHNMIRVDTISGNPLGIWLWEGDPITGYTSWNSNGYGIEHCVMTENGVAVSASNTEDLTMRWDSVAYNANGVHLDGSATGSLILGNVFDRNVLFNIENASPSDIQASYNSYSTGDTLLIAAKIFDKQDNPAMGTVVWQPFVPGPTAVYQRIVPNDLTEGASVWKVFASDGRASACSWDSLNHIVGSASLKVTTQSGFDVSAHYWPAQHMTAAWDLSGATELTVWFKAENVHPFQANSIRIGNESGGYFTYEAPSTVLSSAVGTWRQFIIPLTGDATWQRSTHGTVSLAEISYVEIHADTWDAGFTLWIDGLSFDQPQAVEPAPQRVATYWLAQCYPNPFNPETDIRYSIPVGTYGRTSLRVYDLLGREVAVLVNGWHPAGQYTVHFDAGRLGLSSGTYFYRLTAGDFVATRRMLLLR